MKSKQEVIKSAWLEFMTESDYKNLKIDDNGFCNYQCRIHINSSRWDELYSRIKSGGKTGRDIIYRPKSLSGIETNNGWTRIDSEEDLPTSGMANYMYCTDGKPSIHVVNLRLLINLYKDGMISHYMALPAPEAPIY